MKIFRHHVVELFFTCMGAGSAQFGTNCGRVFYAFYARNHVFVQIEPAVCYTCMLDYYYYFLLFLLKKKTGKNSSL